MKSLITTHLLLNLYLLALIRPALPLIEYAINYDYIVAELCINRTNQAKGCHGKCYLSKQVVDQQDEDHQAPIPKLPKLDVNAFPTVVLNKVLTWDVSDISDIVSHQFTHPKKLISSYLVSIFHPPQ